MTADPLKFARLVTGDRVSRTAGKAAKGRRQEPVCGRNSPPSRTAIGRVGRGCGGRQSRSSHAEPARLRLPASMHLVLRIWWHTQFDPARADPRACFRGSGPCRASAAHPCSRPTAADGGNAAPEQSPQASAPRSRSHLESPAQRLSTAIAVATNASPSGIRFRRTKSCRDNPDQYPGWRASAFTGKPRFRVTKVRGEDHPNFMEIRTRHP